MLKERNDKSLPEVLSSLKPLSNVEEAEGYQLYWTRAPAGNKNNKRSSWSLLHLILPQTQRKQILWGVKEYWNLNHFICLVLCLLYLCVYLQTSAGFPDTFLSIIHSPLPVTGGCQLTFLSCDNPPFSHNVPVLDSIKRLLVCDVIHEDEAHGPSVVSCSDGTITFLTRRILKKNTK